MVVLDKEPQEETPGILDSLLDDQELGRLDPELNRNATLSRKSYANSDIDVLISIAYNIPVMVFGECSNGAGLALAFHYGLQYYDKCKFSHRCIIYC